ncbi:hypothetical protein PIB30_087482 [Stylosanthes scabra]|uniref:Uncharacterized protein n=1 Tax=Stylosanthes scabra TaxID=79078 RepID=A0ABU6QU35_9FABA|nr:hypothetical protein [Stylosanthes scabra]
MLKTQKEEREYARCVSKRCRIAESAFKTVYQQPKNFGKSLKSYIRRKAIGVKIGDEDKALRLILSLPSSFEYMKPVLMYGKETLNFSEVASKVISEERRLKCESRATDSALLVTKNEKRERLKNVRNAMEEDELLADPQLHMGIG